MGGNRKRTADTADADKADRKYAKIILITPAPVETFPSLQDRGLLIRTTPEGATASAAPDSLG